MSETDHPVLPSGYRLVAHETLGSTNDEARGLIAAGAAAGTVVWARSQTAGRGRHGREWVSPVGNLYASIVLHPRVEPERLSEMAFVAALAVRDTILPLVPAEASVALKWPNDVLIDGRKISGILIEAEKLPGEARTALIVGIGVNIVSAPRETSHPATCLSTVARPPRASQVLGALVAALDRRLEQWLRGGFAPVRDEWVRHAYGVGAIVVVGDDLKGAFAGIDESGALLIELPGGECRRVVAGSVRYL